jgi:hypothetical protein
LHRRSDRLIRAERSVAAIARPCLVSSAQRSVSMNAVWRKISDRSRVWVVIRRKSCDMGASPMHLDETDLDLDFD